MFSFFGIETRNISSNCLSPSPRWSASQLRIFYGRQHGISGTTRDPVFHIAQFQSIDSSRFQRNAGIAAAIQSPLRILLPTAFAGIGKMQNTAFNAAIEELG